MKFPAIGMEIDGKFVIDVDCQLDAGGDKDRIETLRLALPQPLGHFVAAAAQVLPNTYLPVSPVTTLVAVPASLIRWWFPACGRFACRFERHHANALSEEGRRVGLAFARDTGNTARIGNPAERPVIASPALFPWNPR